MKTLTSNDGEVSIRIKFDDGFEEYAVQWYDNGTYNEDKTVYTDDREDAIATAKTQLDRYNRLGD